MENSEASFFGTFPESKERLGESLLLARLVAPESNCGLGKIVGIPFERNQLEGIGIRINGRELSLLGIMADLGMIGRTKGLPHLSVGGETTQMFRGLGKWELRTAVLETNAARAYLVDGGLGVQGMGLVRYEGRENKGFGLDGPFVRNAGVLDVGGGIDYHTAERSEIFAGEYFLESAIRYGRPKFARILGIYPYQEWMGTERSNDLTCKTSLVVREDGRRGVSRKELLEAIIPLLPWAADEFHLPEDSFLRDGHNAFKRDGEVIFTDFEKRYFLYSGYEDFMCAFADKWYFDELRKDFAGFCRLFGFCQKGELYEGDLGGIERQVREEMETSTIRKEMMAPIRAFLENRDIKGIERCAMAGLIGSRAVGRWEGRRLMEPLVQGVVDSLGPEEKTLEKALDVFSGLPLAGLLSQSILGETVALEKENGKPCFRVELKTFGLPVEPVIEIPIDKTDIYAMWPYEPISGEKIGLRLPRELTENCFGDAENDFIRSTLYSQLVSVFAGMQSLSFYGLPKDEGTGLITEREGIFRLGGKVRCPELDECPARAVRVTVEERQDVEIDLFPSRGEFTVRMENGAGVFTQAELNKLAYACHLSLKKIGNDEKGAEVKIVVSGIGG